jgi:hypothetical protein
MNDSHRRRAIKRGMDFIYDLACDPDSFAEWGSDLLSCFWFIATTSLDPGLRGIARKMGRERARQWRADYGRLPPDAGVDTIIDYLFGTIAADGLGAQDAALLGQLRDSAARFTARDYLYFDPAVEPPPSDVPEQCECEAWNERGRKRCSRCRKNLSMMSRYKVWYFALIATYHGEIAGVTVGATYAEVLKWLPAMRPYRGREDGDNDDFYDTVYAVTHVVYTLNHYSRYRLSPRWLPQEFTFLKQNLKEAIANEDPEMLGEFLDTLKPFGLGEDHPLIRKGVDYLLATQNADGSWGDESSAETYRRYHPTWTAIDGLREYAWQGKRLSFPELMPRLRQWARETRRGHLKRRSRDW